MTNKPIALILVDGLRPDGLLQANTSTLKRLMLTGAYSLQVQTVLPSWTLPCITSLVLGVPPQAHGTLTNTFASQKWEAPGLIDVLHETGYKTAAFYNWAELRDLARPGSLDLSVCLNTAESHDLQVGESDTALTALAVDALVQHPVDFVFFYLGCVDTAGHRYGWMSPQYIQAIENADLCIERLLDALPEETSAWIIADHGGLGYSHGANSEEELTIPLVTQGSGLPKGVIEGPISILDIAPTIAAYAAAAVPSEWQGHTLLPDRSQTLSNG